ncbi:hypothetical protein G4L39_01000 [Limisphaera ngatamarikiensis]|uniref:P/Homo B domain-containing protein n=1 Tax=Limisphaera ngatamarikiensis TaxID=1324935 RepID=A0A6M1RKH6_9BACT|nr:zinc-dependent metalloprotease family protein [Limisphaera ngatamarikiensis]NGO37977.1 hypothetical protein [Limisphaera ngatamarikiensis]
MNPRGWYAVALCALLTGPGVGRAALPPIPPGEGNGSWRARPDVPLTVPDEPMVIESGDGMVWELDFPEWVAQVVRVPLEGETGGVKSPVSIPLPQADGTVVRVWCWESPVMEPGLQARYPELRTFVFSGVKDPGLRGRLSWTPQGLHGRWRTPRGWSVLEPHPMGGGTFYRAYDLLAVQPVGVTWRCETAGGPLVAAGGSSRPSSAGDVLRVYRLALAGTGEWTAAHGGTVKSGLAAMVILVNQLNAIYEAEVSIRFVLVSQNDRLVYTNAATDPYSGTDAAALLDQNQANLDAVIGDANYDVGHVLSRASGGLASLGVVCRSGLKARGQTGVGNSNDALFTDYVAHELGHQFGATHTFNGVRGTCGSNRHGETAYEPGSGSTLMAYAGNCAGDNVQMRSDWYFHAASLDQILGGVTDGSGSWCGVGLVTGNRPPVVRTAPAVMIPRGTPFVLSAEGTDPDGDPLTFCWEQMDLGPAATLDATDTSQGPLFRSVRPGTNAARIFPSLDALLQNQTNLSEKLPQAGRALRFRVTARDGRGGVGGAETEVTVVGNAGPFRVMFPNGGESLSNAVPVRWDVAGTDQAPLSISHVNLWLSTNNGRTFPHPLVLNTPNDGLEVVVLPPVQTTLARVRVEAVGQPFFDVSDGSFTLLPATPMPSVVLWSVRVAGESCQPTNGVVDPGETVTLAVTLQNQSPTSTSNLVATLLPGGGVTSPGAPQVYGVLGGGQSATRYFTFTAAGRCGDPLEVRWELQDGVRPLGVVSRGLTLGMVQTQTVTRVNPTLIRIPAEGTAGPASVFPSTVVVSGMTGRLARVRVVLTGLNHGFGGDLDVVLVGPQGPPVWLMSDAGNGTNVSGTLTFDDLASSGLPAEGAIRTGTNRPTAYDPDSDPVTVVVGPGPYSFALSALNGLDPNGTWSLYVWDDAPGDVGELTYGWRLELTTTQQVCCGWVEPLPPELDAIPDQVTDEDVPLLGIPVGVRDPDTDLAQVRVWAYAEDVHLVSPAGLVVRGEGAVRWLDVYPEPDAFGATWVRVVAEDGQSSTTNSFLLTVRPVNDPPVWDGPAEIRVHAGMTVVWTNRARDVETPPERLRFVLVGSVPAGMSLDPVTGVVTWSTSDAQSGEVVEVQVRVEDDGDPPASVTGNVRVLVLPRPMVTARLGMAGVLRLEWEAIPGCRYVVEFKERLDDPGWTALGPAVAASGTRLHLLESLSERSRFYRVRVAPVE